MHHSDDGPRQIEGNHSLGTNPPFILENGTTFILVGSTGGGQIIVSPTWNGTYTVWAENVALNEEGIAVLTF